MIYLLFILSLTINGIFVWYIRTLIRKYIFNAEIIDSFKEMLEKYSDSLSSLYKLEELYGNENIKKAIDQTKFVITACDEFKGSLVESEQQPEEDEPEQKETNVIRLKDGEKVSQTASSYKRIIVDS